VFQIAAGRNNRRRGQMAKYETRGRKVAVGGCARAEQLGIDSPHCLRRCNNGIDDFPLSSLRPVGGQKVALAAIVFLKGLTARETFLKPREGSSRRQIRGNPARAGRDPNESRSGISRPGELGDLLSSPPRCRPGFSADASSLAGNERRRNPSSEPSRHIRPSSRSREKERERWRGHSLPARLSV